MIMNDTAMDLVLQQDERLAFALPISKASKKSPLRSSKDALEVVPTEFYSDNQQGPQAIPVKEGIEVVPFEQQETEPGLQIRMGREEKETRASSDLTSGLQLDDRDKANNSAPLKRFSLQKAIVFIVIAAIIIVVVVVPVNLLKRSKGSSSPPR